MRRYYNSYRVLMPYMSIGTIDQTTYDRFKTRASVKLHGNQYVKTLIVTDNYTTYQVIRDSYKEQR